MKLSLFAQPSELILRHSDKFTERRVLFAGDLQDDLPGQLDTAFSRVHTQQYHYWQIISRTLEEDAYYSLIANIDMVANCDTLIYFWSKNKLEAQFQLQNLLALMPLGCDIFIAGKNHSGVRSAEKIIKSWSSLEKIDSARHCCLYQGYLKKQPSFAIEDFWYEYSVGSLKVKTLPGVFSYGGLDNGSQMLLSTLQPNMKGKVLDIGSGSGVLAAMLASFSPKVLLTLSDVHAAAIEASKATLAANHFEGEVLVSNVYSNIDGRFDMIISNPPFHNGVDTSFDTAQRLILGAINQLNTGGELRIVANAFLPYSQMLDKAFGSHDVLLKNGRFKVYRAVKDYPPKEY